jgi:hypothetical protein
LSTLTNVKKSAGKLAAKNQVECLSLSMNGSAPVKLPNKAGLWTETGAPGIVYLIIPAVTGFYKKEGDSMVPITDITTLAAVQEKLNIAKPATNKEVQIKALIEQGLAPEIAKQILSMKK